jgi:hypothetical protein
MKNYIASEDLGITTSSGLVRNLFGKAIDLGRRYKQTKDDKDFFEALRLLGTGCHCLEDFSAHSNYTELALIEMGERDIFPHVGRRTQMQVRGVRNPVFPIVTGTFGGVDFLHSVMGEFSDKATQSELEELEGAISHAKNSDTSLLKDILKKIPSGVFGSGSEDPAGKADELQANANAAHMENMHISPKEPEAFTRQVNDIMKQIYPIIEFHDQIMKGISSAIDKIPILPDLIEQLQDQVNLFVFSLLAPYIMPIISQVKNELHTGSSEVIKSSQEHQMAVFSNDNDTDPTHSMLSKDHFSNVLNEPAGKVASAVLKWVVPQIVECWDDDNADIARTLDRIVNGVLHHPALREYGDDGARDGRGLMFREVEKWWNDLGDRERDGLRRSLSRDGVQHFKNHKEGVKDKGHGCGKPLGLPTRDTYESSGATGGKSSDAGDLLGGIASALGNASGGSGNSGSGFNSEQHEKISDTVSEAVGGGAIGSIVGGFASNILGNAAKNAMKNASSSHENGSTYNPGNQSGNSYSSNQQSSGYGQGNSYNSGNQGGSYGSSQQSSGYGRDDSYGSNQQSSGYGRDTSSNSYQSGGHNQSTSHSSSGYQASHQQSGYSSQTDQYGSTGRRDDYGQESHSGRTGYGSEAHERRSDRSSEHQSKHSSSRRDDSDDDDSNDDDDYEKKQRKREKKEQKRLKKLREEEEKKSSYGGSSRRDEYGSSSRRDDDDYPARQPAYGEEQNYSSGHGRQNESSHNQSSRYEQSSGSSRYEQSSSSGYGGNTYSSSDRYESSTPSYGGNSHSSSEYPGNHGRTSGGYGSTTSGYGDDSRGSSGYGNTQSSSAEYGSSGYGNESRQYGSSERREGHGRRDEYGDSGSADMPGGFGGEESYGDSRRRNDGDEYGSSGYGNSGYGGSSGGYGSRY